MARKDKTQPKRRYGVMYFFDSKRIRDPNAWGSTETFIAACGNAARHVARADFDSAEYRKAVIFDRHQGRIVRIYSRTAEGMSIKDY
jgi:hypothetical protein